MLKIIIDVDIRYHRHLVRHLDLPKGRHILLVPVVLTPNARIVQMAMLGETVIVDQMIMGRAHGTRIKRALLADPCRQRAQAAINKDVAVVVADQAVEPWALLDQRSFVAFYVDPNVVQTAGGRLKVPRPLDSRAGSCAPSDFRKRTGH